MPEPFSQNTPVSHPRHGTGHVLADMGEFILVRFGPAIQQVPREQLSPVRSLDQALSTGTLDPSADALLRASALAIRSVNDQWGVFSRSRVQLLPHQLWVCHRVNRSYPFRWLVADDVGLGKTIEAGLVLMPLVARAQVRRLLILAPAKLVPQWQKRMRTMFDIRLQVYDRAVDTGQVDFWDTANMVVASIHTLRREITEDREDTSRFLAADAWDAVVVDEAHHLNTDERTGETLSFQLLRAMEERRRIGSLLLFTGTPHRGKDHGFLSLLSLLDREVFGPDRDPDEQLARLPDYMIRNNKATVTDLNGNRLFTPITVDSREYSFSPEERAFYDTLSAFIIDGRAYASTLGARAQSQRMLLLIALQKLAASSIAAIRNALAKRRARLAELAESMRPPAATISEGDGNDTLDDRARADEDAWGRMLAELMDDEVARLEELLELAEPIRQERKIDRLVELIESELPPSEPVLLFTEYKATQAMVVDALHARFGHGCCAFINGDERLDDLAREDGTRGPRSWARDAAAEAFNGGKVRFLQTRPVQVYILRNPDTVEARIWDLLNTKLERIQRTLDVAMDEREDISQLVIGMTAPGTFEQLFAEGQARPRESLDEWFNRESATIGGEDLVRKVKSMLGNVARFDFASVGRNLPQVDLPDLERFFIMTMEHQGRRVLRRDEGFEVIAPEPWVDEDYAMQPRYKGLMFDRHAKLGASEGPTRLLGVGHVLFDRALKEGERTEACLATCARLDRPLLIASVEDQVTGQDQSITRIVIAAFKDETGTIQVLRDWELLKLLNGLGRSDLFAPTFAGGEKLRALQTELLASMAERLTEVAEMMSRPGLRNEMMLLPESF